MVAAHTATTKGVYREEGSIDTQESVYTPLLQWEYDKRAKILTYHFKPYMHVHKLIHPVYMYASSSTYHNLGIPEE